MIYSIRDTWDKFSKECKCKNVTFTMTEVVWKNFPVAAYRETKCTTHINQAAGRVSIENKKKIKIEQKS